MKNQKDDLDRPEPTLSTSDVAKYCRTSVVNVNRWITTGLLESYRYPNGRYKITKNNFRKFLMENNIPIITSFFEERENIKVMIGEDDQDFAIGLKKTLLKKVPNLEIEVLEDGYEVLLRMGSIRPDILILDIELPTINGLEVCRRIKEQKDIQKTKIIAITAHSKRYKKEDVLQYGADAFLIKPIKIKEFFQLFEKLLGDKLDSSIR